MTDGEENAGSKKKGNPNKKYQDNKDFRAFMQEFELQRARGFTAHPKIEKLKTILIQHFASAIHDEGEDDDTKVMVFSTYRDVVEEIVKELESERPLIRATRFIGQSTSKQGGKGMGQKEQLDVRVSVSLITTESLNQFNSASNDLNKANSMSWSPLVSEKRGWISVSLT